MVMLLNIVIAALSAALLGLLAAYLRARKRSTQLAEELAIAQRDASHRQSALDERQQLDTIKDEFISTVSHELRTPLTSIRGALGLLSSGIMGKLDDKAANLLRIASTNTDRLVRLINDILDLERMESGRAALQMRRCALHELILQAVDTMTAQADAADVRLIVLPERDDEPIVFDGDPDRIQQVLCNLLSNAIKFSPRGSSVRVLTGADGPSFVLRVEDGGRGVPADKLESIFDRFGQVEPSDAKVKGGTGLGLAICRSILSQHNGTIWAERNDTHGVSRPGTTFSFRMPRCVSADAASPLAKQAEGAILVVDDDPNTRHAVTELLRRNGYNVLETDRGQQAIHIAENQTIEAILLDLYMPGMSGWQTIETLKRNPTTANIPIVVLSVLSPGVHPDDRPPLLETTQGWVQKPFSEGLLLTELGRVLHAGSGPGKVLLIEDDHDLATVIMASFEKDDSLLSVQHVSSMGEARLACQTDPPDMLILDLTLPDGSGFALVEWLRRQPTLRTLPLIVYSGRDVSPAEMEQLRLGPTQFLAKARVQPHDVEELVLAMVRHLRAPGTKIPAA